MGWRLVHAFFFRVLWSTPNSVLWTKFYYGFSWYKIQKNHFLYHRKCDVVSWLPCTEYNALLWFRVPTNTGNFYGPRGFILWGRIVMDFGFSFQLLFLSSKVTKSHIPFVQWGKEGGGGIVDPLSSFCFWVRETQSPKCPIKLSGGRGVLLTYFPIYVPEFKKMTKSQIPFVRWRMLLTWFPTCVRKFKNDKIPNSLCSGVGGCWATEQLLFLSSKMTKSHMSDVLGAGGIGIKRGLPMCGVHLEPQFGRRPVLVLLSNIHTNTA